MDQIIIDESFVKSDLINIRGQKYPNILISKETLVKPSIAPDCYSNDIFIENDNYFWKRVFNQYRHKGFCSTLSFVAQYGNDHKNEESSYVTVRCFYWIAFVILYIQSLYSNIYYYFYPYDKLSDEELLTVFSDNLDWKNGLIRAFEWHPSSLCCSMSLSNDLIYVYSADTHRPINHICCLKNMEQKRISSMAWHPKRSDILAVSSQSKILFWSIESDMNQFKADAQKCLNVVDSKLPSPLTSIVFHPEGNTLVACSPRSSSISIISFNWNSTDNPIKNCKVRLVMIPFCPRFTTLKWSPDKRRLLVHTTSNKMVVFENLQWSSKSWKSNLSSYVQSSVWSKPNGRIVLFVAKNSSKVYAMTFYDDAEAGDVGGSPDNSVLLLDTADQHFSDNQLGINIHTLAWDRSSSCLAISFKDKPELIALFRTHLTFSLQFAPLCTIKSEFSSSMITTPLVIKFHDHYLEDGCLLSICWSNGMVSHVCIPNGNSSKILEEMASPRSLTTLCTTIGSPNQSELKSPQSLNSSVVNPLKSSNANISKCTSPLNTLCSTRRTNLFSTRVKFD
ncbi:hypothetical protein RDWZM_001921 [Blomia tropicalis]|uniref:Aladin seven-bladed propeller domain-containing protein n=1 Tax=Blomia tropicalis TaxID=40697 RepID=A0A9Q0RRR4_BLOTA|nr:hypothetical protein RDWZM_001921 [Blomia tropicalis]